MFGTDYHRIVEKLVGYLKDDDEQDLLAQLLQVAAKGNPAPLAKLVESTFNVKPAHVPWPQFNVAWQSYYHYIPMVEPDATIKVIARVLYESLLDDGADYWQYCWKEMLEK